MGLQISTLWRSAIRLCLIISSLILLPAASTLHFSPALNPITKEAAWQAGVPQGCSQPVPQDWVNKVKRLRWVAYSPSNRKTGQTPGLTAQILRDDLAILRSTGFTGIITYGSAGILGQQFITVAETVGFRGVIMGIWNPDNPAELRNALQAAERPIVLGYSVGNEGLSERPERYSLDAVCTAISGLRAGTGKPAATSEDIQTYYRRPELVWAGDWIFAIAHPYWHNTKDPQEAIRWEQKQYAALQERTDQFIFFKEVGLPSAGAPGLSETSQDLFYRGLDKTQVQFAYFEGFDQASKSYNPVEPHWGIFRSNLEPKLLAWNLMEYQVFTSKGENHSRVLQCETAGADGCTELPERGSLLVGRGQENREYRALLSFDTSGLPDEALITSIKLKIKVADKIGPHLLNKRQEITVDLCPISRVPAAGPAKACSHNAGKVNKMPVGGWYLAELDTEAWTSINLRGETQFRLRLHEVGSMKTARNYLVFEAVGPNAPVLVVRYELP